MLSRHLSFTLSRSGLKPGHYVPARLRIADTLTVFTAVLNLVVVITLAVMSLQWSVQLGMGFIWKNPVAFVVYSVTVTVLAGWAVEFASVRVLRRLFRIFRMITDEEARSYPLISGKHRFDPWPDSWQKRCSPPG